MNPRLPVLVGVGQVTWTGVAPEPLELLVEAAQRAGADGGVPLSGLDFVGVVHVLSRRYGDPARRVAERLGAEPKRTAVTATGGQGPQALLDRVAAGILAGEVDAALVCGAESWRTRAGWARRGERPPWPTAPTDRAPDEVVGPAGSYRHPAEEAVGLELARPPVRPVVRGTPPEPTAPRSRPDLPARWGQYPVRGHGLRDRRRLPPRPLRVRREPDRCRARLGGPHRPRSAASTSWPWATSCPRPPPPSPPTCCRASTRSSAVTSPPRVAGTR